MEEYEIRDLGASMTSNIIEMAGMQGDYIAIYISVVFAFIAASYVVGREFNKVQTTVATGLFCLVCFWLVYRITMFGVGINFMMEVSNKDIYSQIAEEGSGWRDVVEGGYRVVITAAIWSLGMIGALIFLWDIRHRQNS
jgi:hypothetical protein